VPVIRHKHSDRRDGREGRDGQKGFRVPFGPYLIPGLSILSCLYIIKDLSVTTYTVFAVWMAFALCGYFLYGIWHSRLNRVNP
jgi:APA family basic amino acid/polyamine antiporter